MLKKQTRIKTNGKTTAINRLKQIIPCIKYCITVEYIIKNHKKATKKFNDLIEEYIPANWGHNAIRYKNIFIK